MLFYRETSLIEVSFAKMNVRNPIKTANTFTDFG